MNEKKFFIFVSPSPPSRQALVYCWRQRRCWGSAAVLAVSQLQLTEPGLAWRHRSGAPAGLALALLLTPSVGDGRYQHVDLDVDRGAHGMSPSVHGQLLIGTGKLNHQRIMEECFTAGKYAE